MSAQQVTKSDDRPVVVTSKERGRALSTKVRTTFEPEKVLEVDDAELVDLSRQKVLHSFERNDSTDALGIGKSPNRWRDGKPEETEGGVLDAPGDEPEGGAS